MSDDMCFAPHQVALILGTPGRDIWDEIKAQKLQSNSYGRYHSINLKQLISYLKEFPEKVGRVYCDDIPGYITEIRKYIVDQLEV